MMHVSLPYLIRSKEELDISAISVSKNMLTSLFDFINEMEGNELYKTEILWYEIKDQNPLLEEVLVKYFLSYTGAKKVIRIFHDWGQAFISLEREWLTPPEYISLCRGFIQLKETLLTDDYSLYNLSGENLGKHQRSVVKVNERITNHLIQFRENFFTPMANEIHLKVRENK